MNETTYLESIEALRAAAARVHATMTIGVEHNLHCAAVAIILELLCPGDFAHVFIAGDETTASRNDLSRRGFQWRFAPTPNHWVEAGWGIAQLYGQFDGRELHYHDLPVRHLVGALLMAHLELDEAKLRGEGNQLATAPVTAADPLWVNHPPLNLFLKLAMAGVMVPPAPIPADPAEVARLGAELERLDR